MNKRIKYKQYKRKSFEVLIEQVVSQGELLRYLSKTIMVLNVKIDNLEDKIRSYK